MYTVSRLGSRDEDCLLREYKPLRGHNCCLWHAINWKTLLFNVYYFITSKCTIRWCLSLSTQVYVYRTNIVPQVLYGAPLWYHKNTHQLRCLQTNVMRKIFKHGPSPSIEACAALTGVPPIDIYCESIAVKFAIKIRQNDDLVRDTHLKSISKSRSRAISLESSLKRYSRFMN